MKVERWNLNVSPGLLPVLAFFLVWLPSGTVRGAGLVELPAAEEYSFEHGYEVIELTGGGSRVVKSVPGPATANIAAYLDIEGERFYLSDWSHERLKKGEGYYWVRARAAPVKPLGSQRATPVRPAVPEPKDFAGLVVLPKAGEVRFANGYQVVEQPAAETAVLEKAPAPGTVGVRAYLDAAGTRYFLSDENWERRGRGESFHWITALKAPAPAKPPGAETERKRSGAGAAEGTGGLLPLVGDPALAAEIVVGLKGLPRANWAWPQIQPGQEGDYPEIVAIRGELEKLRQSGGLAATPEQLEAVLGNGEALVDIFLSRDRGSGQKAEFYGAIVLARGQGPRVVRIGNRADIDGFVGGLRSFLQGNEQSASMNRAKRDAATAQLLRQGYDLVMRPMESEIRVHPRLTICGDGQLLLLPFELLRKAGADWGEAPLIRPVGELWEVRYLNETRDLLRNKPRELGAEGRTAFLVGAPDFDLKIPGLSGEGGGEKSREIRLAPLEGGKEEIEKLKSWLTEKKVATAVVTGAEATEQNVTGRMKSPSILHLGTYGFFAGQTPAGPAGFRAGIALAGARTTLAHWDPKESPGVPGDGILAAGEMADLDLGGTEVVVLAGCAAAAGESLSGAGMVGFRAALIQAGARNVVLPLWPAGGGETSDLMERFYKEMLKGKAVPAALADARGQVFREIERKEGLFEAARRAGAFIAVSAEPFRAPGRNKKQDRD